MSHLRTIGIFAILLLSASTVNAATVDQSFRNCAAKAMQQRDQNVASIVVDNRDFSSAELDHNYSGSQRQYRMKLTDNKSGKFIGEVTCKLSQVGEIISAVFES